MALPLCPMSGHLSLSCHPVIGPTVCNLMLSCRPVIVSPVCTPQPIFSHCHCVHCLHISACLVSLSLCPLSAHLSLSCLTVIVFTVFTHLSLSCLTVIVSHVQCPYDHRSYEATLEAVSRVAGKKIWALTGIEIRASQKQRERHGFDLS